MQLNRWLVQLVFAIITLTVPGRVSMLNAQEANPDSLYAAKLMEDNLTLYREVDSLENTLYLFRQLNERSVVQIDSLREATLNLERKVSSFRQSNDSLVLQINDLNHSLVETRQELIRLRDQLETKSSLLQEKELQLMKTEYELKEIQNSGQLTRVKLEGSLDVHNTKLEAKDREIAYLKNSIEEKEKSLSERNNEIRTFYQQKDNSLKIIDSLSRNLNQKELEITRISERLRIIESQYNELLARQNAATNKKKKIRFIQGVGIKNYRTPDWELAPQSSSSSTVLVISNKNAGKMDVDYITGISLSLYDLTKENSKFTYDAGVFVGFGGQNLFKNFYIGPSVKVFDFFHINTGVNFAEYQQLKPGFKEGDQPGSSGLSSVLVKQWKTNFFFGFTLDLELLSNIPRKM
jgi:predicted  nucleic acid-binding Zn-ribbon protein